MSFRRGLLYVLASCLVVSASSFCDDSVGASSSQCSKPRSKLIALVIGITCGSLFLLICAISYYFYRHTRASSSTLPRAPRAPSTQPLMSQLDRLNLTELGAAPPYSSPVDRRVLDSPRHSPRRAEAQGESPRERSPREGDASLAREFTHEVTEPLPAYYRDTTLPSYIPLQRPPPPTPTPSSHLESARTSSDDYSSRRYSSMSASEMTPMICVIQ